MVHYSHCFHKQQRILSLFVNIKEIKMHSSEGQDSVNCQRGQQEPHSVMPFAQK